MDKNFYVHLYFIARAVGLYQWHVRKVELVVICHGREKTEWEKGVKERNNDHRRTRNSGVGLQTNVVIYKGIWE